MADARGRRSRGGLADHLEAARLVGGRAIAYRLREALLTRTGLDVRYRPVRAMSSEAATASRAGTATPTEPAAFVASWMTEPAPFFVDGLDGVSGFLRARATSAEAADIAARGAHAAHGTVQAFRGWPAAYGHPPAWTLNPVRGVHWSAHRHSRRVLTPDERARVGDIKLTWEIGRFLHVPDVLRAFALTGDPALPAALVEQVASFEEGNPRYLGPHWMGEQEVGIRTCMLTLALHALRGSAVLDAPRALVLLRSVVAGAEYCFDEIGLARHCINNNHLIAGALGMYVPGCAFPWHARAERWRRRGRDLLMEALRTQWYDDGGYTQPSHNYHRLALGYLLWAWRLAEREGDTALLDVMRGRFERSLRLLRSMADARSGALPNWGPNDGALFVPWTSCAFSDFRPLLTALRYAVAGHREFEAGPWDEELVWLWGPKAAQAPVEPVTMPVAQGFTESGLHVMRGAESALTLRCGPIRSRFGQQADQLHVDLWWRGRNVLLDAGSYSYDDAAAHEWFRSTDAHNTVSVDGESQMVPYRQFLFLGWPRARLIALPAPPPGITSWRAGWHDGYRRLRRRVVHARLVAGLSDGCWVVVDHLRALRAGGPARVAVRWHFAAGLVRLEDERAELVLDVGTFALAWAGPGLAQATLAEAAESPVDGWASRHYGLRTPAPSLALGWPLDTELVVATVMGAAEQVKHIRVDAGAGTVSVGAVAVPLEALVRRAGIA